MARPCRRFDRNDFFPLKTGRTMHINQDCDCMSPVNAALASEMWSIAEPCSP